MLLLTVFAMCSQNACKSVRFMYHHFLRPLAKRKLSSLYAMLNEATIDLSSRLSNFCRLLVRLIPESCRTYPIFLVIDDTLIEKVGTHFEAWAKLFDHASHNGTNYLNGHCVVTLVVLVPFLDENGHVTYERVPMKHKLWVPKKNKGKDKKAALDRESIVSGIPYRSKYELLREILEEAVSALGADRNSVLLADSWYPKGEILEFVNGNGNVAGVFNVPINTVLYDKKVQEHTGKRGRPREVGDRLRLKSAFSLVDIPDTNYRAGWRDVTTNLFGRKRLVRALPTESRDAKSRRLFLCTIRVCVKFRLNA